MTSQKDQIQALITDIDSVLQKTTPRLPWVVSGEMTQQRQILERVRNYLVTFQRQQSVGESYGQAGARPDLLAHDIHYQYQPTQPPYQAPPIEAQGARSQPYGQDELSAQQMLQVIVHDMGYLRANVMQPLQSDLDALRQQREALVQEIHQLEAQRQGYAGQLPGNQQQMIAEFLQALMSRLQETLPQQVAQTLRGSNQQSLPSSGNLALSGAAAPIQMTSNPNAQGLGNIQVAQSQSDELLIKLDSTLSVVFESLQRNVQAYEESLSQGLEKMHSMGQQGEMMFTALISHLASQLGQEAATYLQPSAATGSQPATAAQPAKFGQPKSGQPNVEQPTTDTGSQPLRLPFPGTELSSSGTGAGAGAAANRTEPSVDTAIDAWLRSASSVDAPSTADFELAELNLEGFDLNQLAAQDVNALLELDANLLNTNLPPQPFLAPTEPSNAPTQPTNESAFSATSSGMSIEDTADIDAALKLLEQLSSELQEQPASMADADAQLDRMLSTPSQTGETAASGIPDDARDELDEFYESLFGNNAIATAPSSATPSSATPSSETASATDTPVAATVPVATGTPPVVSTPPIIGSPAAGTSPVAGNVEADAVDSTYTVSAETTQAPATQPVEALPAETQAAPLTAPALVSAPAVSAGNDPTLGWDLLAKPLTAPAGEPEIPAALLDDELLNGWDFEDAEMNLATPEPVTAGKELLGVGETSTTIAPLSVAPPSQPGTIAPDSSVSQSPPIAPDAAPLQSDAVPSDVVPSDVVPSATPSGSPDEITTLADLFDEPLPGGGQETPIAHPVVPTESLSQPPATASSENTAVTSSATSGQPTSGQPTSGQPTSGQPTSGQPDDRLGDDRYTPAPPEEDLLPLEEPIDDSDPELWLDESTLNRLSEDLFSLEETIGEPSILPYGAEAEANAPMFYPDATIPDATIPDATTSQDATASQDATRVNEPTALDDWGASLDEFADSLSTPASTPASTVYEPGAIATEPPGAFLLEGMDDLFADTPVVPSVTPVPPPAVSTQAELPTAFTLEGMDDLFADALTGSAPLPPTVPTAHQPQPFTLEGIDQLFDDVPMVTATPVPSAPDAPSDTSLPFTLDGVDELFADAPSVSNVPPASNVLPDAGAFSVPEPSIADVPTSPETTFTLDTSDQFVAAPTAASPPPEQASDSTIAPSSPTSTAPTSQAIAPFTFEQVGDLFMEVPSEGLPLSGQPISESAAAVTAAQPSETVPEPVPAPAIAPFTLERVGDVFIERPSEAASSDSPAISSNAPTSPSLPTAEPSTAVPSTAEPSASKPSTLEQAFASLMGSFDDPMTGADRTETDTTDPEKKK